MRKRLVEILVGIFLLLGALALAFLALRVSGLTSNGGLFDSHSYSISANFNQIGSLKVRSPVRIAGVTIGEVTSIKLNPSTYQAKVSMRINSVDNTIPTDSSASIDQMGLLGDNYVSISPGYNTATLKNDGQIQTTYPATSIQSLLTTFLGGIGDGKDSKK